MLKLAYNTTDTVIVVDSQGHAIGGHEWGSVDTTDEMSTGELDAGRVIYADEKAAAKSGNPLAVAAVEQLALRRERQAKAVKADKDALAEALPDETLEAMDSGGDGLPAKADLVDAVVADESVEVPGKTTTKSRSAAKK